jgi:hypothetical protein
MFVGLIAIFFIIKSGVNDYETYYQRTSYLKQAEYDFKVYRPANHQIDDIASHASIDAVFPFYLRSATINLLNHQDKKPITIKFAKDLYDLNLTEFSDKRLIEASTEATQDAQIYIDEIASKTLGLSLNDKVNINITGLDVLTFSITRIYENHGFYQEGIVFFYYTPQIEQAFILNELHLRYEGMYIKSKDTVATHSFLQTYVPLGNLLPAIYFGSQSEYDQYVINFMNQDYSSQIFIKSNVLNERELNNHYLLESANSKQIYAAIFLGLGTLLLSLKVVYGFKYASIIESHSLNSVIQRHKFLYTYLISDATNVFLTGIIIFMIKQAQPTNAFTQTYLNDSLQLVLVVLSAGYIINSITSVISSARINRNNLNRAYS